MKNVLLTTALVIGLSGIISSAEARTYSFVDARGISQTRLLGDTYPIARGAHLDNPNNYGAVKTHMGDALIHKPTSVVNRPESMPGGSVR